MDEILEFMKKNETYYLATVDENGDPQVRAFGTFSMIDGKFYIETGRTKKVAKEIANHPRIAICDFATDGSQWLRIEADAYDTNDPELEQKVLDEYPDLQGMYKAGDGNTCVMRLDNVTATFSSFTAEPRKVL
jgi:uncharacterized pyridoxamine 5'-phosphate oxidase family protein